MKKTLFALASIFVAGNAFAAGGSDHFGSYGANQPAPKVDSGYSVTMPDGVAAMHKIGTSAKKVAEGAPRLGGNS